jgi:hypothetical protein
MVTYARLSQHGQASRSLIGMTLAEFDRLYAEFEPAHHARRSQMTTRRKDGQPRQRAVGGGPKYRYDVRDRLLMTLFWLRVYTTYEVLGFVYGLNKTNVEDILHDIMATLEHLTTFTFDRPDPGRQKLSSAQAVMDAFPSVRMVIDAKEQRIQRPHDDHDEQGQRVDRQRPYYSGKKKTHTLKTQLAVRPDGVIEAVSDSVPGSTHDLTLLRQTELMTQLDEDEAAMLDKGYDGLQNDCALTHLVQPYKARRNHPLTDEQKAFNQIVSRYRIVVEHTIAQLNRFQVLKQVFRHALGWHTHVARVVAGLVNRHLYVRPLKVYATA